MNHPDLEKKLQELKAQRKETTQGLRDLATEAIESTDKVNKTMMMYLTPAGQKEGCECTGAFCYCDKAPKTSRLFKKKSKKSK